MSRIFSNIKRLKKKEENKTPKFNFNTGIARDKIELFEKAFGVVMPESYKQFLEKYNGGMILEEEKSYYEDMTDWEPDGPKYSSFYLFALDELQAKYIETTTEDWLLDGYIKGNYPFIPICTTPKQGLIFVISQKGLENESPVFINYDKSDSSTCTKIADNFNTFLGYYIEADGFPALLPADIEPKWQTFMNKYNILDIAKSNEEIIERNTAYLQLFPDSGWSLNERGISYRSLGQRQLALEDFNKSIEINNKQSFFYYCRGDLILDYGSPRKALIDYDIASPRKALIDYDIAVKLEPGNNLFLSGRADALQKLGKLNKALADCNKILDEDNEYTLALYVRERVYKAMGEDELAQVDSDLIDELK